MVMHKVEPVCPEPKVFVGQVPIEATQDQVYKVFSQYGNITNCVIILGPDRRSKGAAMVLYDRWSEAELAIETENGTTNLGGTKPLVVRIADPPKREGPVTGIAPKKLFIGQIPGTISEAELKNLFAPYGNIVELALLKKNAGAACAFVTYERWSQCEAAIEAHNGKTHLEGAKMPMVVKFADAKVEGAGNMNMAMAGMNMANMGGKRPFNNMDPAGGNSNKKQFNGMGGGFNAYGMGGFDMNAMAAMAQMGNMGAMGYGMGMNPMAGMMGMGMGGMGMGNMGNAGMPRNNGSMAMQTNRMGPGMADDSAKQWKLFVGQVPFEATEQDLWPVFSEIGNVLELVILRNPQGRSRGCAFVTYENRLLSEKAIRQIDGKVYLPNDPKQRVLIVKYASQSSGGGSGGGSSMGAGSAGLSNMGQGMSQGMGQGMGQGMAMGQGMPGMMGGMMGADASAMMGMGGMMGGMGTMPMMTDQPQAAYGQQQGFNGAAYGGQF